MEQSDDGFDMGSAALIPSPCNPPPDLDGRCVRLRRLAGKPYLDAYTGGNAVTRSYQANDTQTWCFAIAGSAQDPSAPIGVSTPTYSIQHLSSGRFLDALGASDDYQAVMRHATNTDTQRWIPSPACDSFHLQQVSSGRSLDAYNSSGYDYRAVLRSWQNDGTQSWVTE
jgi:hypothetical protein